MMKKQRSIWHTTNARGVVRIVSVLLVAACCLMNSGTAFADAPIGWAVVSGKGVESTTGGGDGKVVVARTIEELADYTKRIEPLTILVEGTLSGKTINIASNKTIMGGWDPMQR